MKPFEFDQTWEFDVSDAALWEAIQKTDDYSTWWPWLRQFELSEVGEGETATFAVKSPLPYSLHFEATILKIVPQELVEVHVTGDVSGNAKLEIEPHRHRCSANLRWSLTPEALPLRTAALVARPVMKWSRDWVVAQGAEQFRQHALAEG